MKLSTRDVKTLFAALRMYQAHAAQPHVPQAITSEEVERLVDGRIDAALNKLADTIHYDTEAPAEVKVFVGDREVAPGQDPFGRAADVLDPEG